MSEKLIAAGRVEVNGEVVQQMGLRIDPSVDVVRVDGTRVQVNEEMVYFALNKPRGVHSTMHDDLGRPHVGELIEAKFNQGQGLFHVGRHSSACQNFLQSNLLLFFLIRRQNPRRFILRHMLVLGRVDVGHKSVHVTWVALQWRGVGVRPAVRLIR